MSVGNKYSIEPKEYLEMLLYGIENINEDHRIDYIKNAYLETEIYKHDKSYYDSLPMEEKIKIEILDFRDSLRKEIDEMRKIEYILNFGKLNKDNTEDENKIDTRYEKTSFIIFEFLEKMKLYSQILTNKSNNKFFNPPLTQSEIDSLTFRMITNEYSRLRQNIMNYNIFLKMLSSFYNIEGDNTSINSKNIKTSILMFLLDCDYENNSQNYDLYDFSKIKINCRENKDQNGQDDTLTIKAKNRLVAKMIRDAASHGEFYFDELGNNSIQSENSTQSGNIKFSLATIRIENSKYIPRINFNIPYEILETFVMDNLSEEIKAKYKFLIEIINSEKMEDQIFNSKIDKNAIQEFMILMLNNIIQYNTEHHFKDLEMERIINLSSFRFYNMLDGEREMTNDLSPLKKLMNIKNALGHNHVNWLGDNLELINDWIPPRGKPKKNKVVISFEELVTFFLQSNLYNISTISQSNYEMYHSIHNRL